MPRLGHRIHRQRSVAGPCSRLQTRAGELVYPVWLAGNKNIYGHDISALMQPLEKTVLAICLAHPKLADQIP